ncbi:unnamed protein product [Candidula unifasciata]|uniref:Kynurenine formamidase n=1 Tax=Candidula unifasciata TaxID=100452 RepID=A0A8S3Z428_9EUPU|nr:unnamed protein product [Candidula unifasciata]
MSFHLHYVFSIALMISCTGGKIIDLSHKHGPKTLTSLYGSPGYNLTTLQKGTSALGIYIEMNYYGSSEHGGTHIDAPSHFVEGGMKLDEIPIEYTILEGVVIDISKEAAANNAYAVNVQRLKDWEKVNGEIPRNSAVLFYFGWYQKFDNEKAYRGTSDLNNIETYIYPYVTLEAAKWLLDERDVRAYGSDTITLDPFQINKKFSGFPIHVLLLPHNRIIIENLRDLDRLPPRGFRFHCSPVKYVGASGTQVRAYAMTYDGEGNGAGLTEVSSFVIVLFAALLTYPW